uniref:Kinesin motor domain-containing protein n=1 Tax=Ditylum brightwellii TaxID=49249 RepID=A0A6V2LQC9_9STRA
MSLDGLKYAEDNDTSTNTSQWDEEEYTKVLQNFKSELSLTQQSNNPNSQYQENNSIKVAIRVRPTLPGTYEYTASTCVEIDDPIPPSSLHKTLHIPKSAPFTFDQILTPETSQKQMYQYCILPMMESSITNHHHSTVFTYGPSGSGKTHTMIGKAEKEVGLRRTISRSEEEEEAEKSGMEPDWGIVPRALAHIFTRLEDEKTKRVSKKGKQRFHYEVDLTCVEFHGDKLKDLLTTMNRASSSKRLLNLKGNVAATESKSSGGDLKIRDVKNETTGLMEAELVGATTITTTSYDQAMRHMKRGTMNSRVRNSGSHSMTTISITQWRKKKKKKGRDESTIGSFTTATNGAAGSKMEVDMRECKIHFVELAGADSLKRGGKVEAQRTKDNINNKSLTVLSQVLTALGRQKSEKPPTIPYTESKLTHLLRESLSSNNHKMLMIACISPSTLCLEESLRCLRYAHRVKYIESKGGGSSSFNSSAAASEEEESTSKNALNKKIEEVLEMRLQMKVMESKIMTQNNQIESLNMELQQLRERNNSYSNAISVNSEANHTGVTGNSTVEEELKDEMAQHQGDLKYMATEMLDLERQATKNKSIGKLFFNKTLLKVLAQGQTLGPSIVKVMKEVELQNDVEKAQMMELTIHESLGLPPDVPPSPTNSNDDNVDNDNEEDATKKEDGSSQKEDEILFLKSELQAVKEDRDLLRERLDFQLKQNSILEHENHAVGSVLLDATEQTNLAIPYLESHTDTTTNTDLVNLSSRLEKESIPFRESSSPIKAYLNGNTYKDPSAGIIEVDRERAKAERKKKRGRSAGAVRSRRAPLSSVNTEGGSDIGLSPGETRVHREEEEAHLASVLLSHVSHVSKTERRNLRRSRSAGRVTSRRSSLNSVDIEGGIDIGIPKESGVDHGGGAANPSSVPNFHLSKDERKRRRNRTTKQSSLNSDDHLVHEWAADPSSSVPNSHLSKTERKKRRDRSTGRRRHISKQSSFSSDSVFDGNVHTGVFGRNMVDGEGEAHFTSIPNSHLSKDERRRRRRSRSINKAGSSQPLDSSSHKAVSSRALNSSSHFDGNSNKDPPADIVDPPADIVPLVHQGDTDQRNLSNYPAFGPNYQPRKSSLDVRRSRSTSRVRSSHLKKESRSRSESVTRNRVTRNG